MFKYVAIICSLTIFMFSAPLWAAEALEGVYSEPYGIIKVVVKDDANYRVDILEEGDEPVVVMAVGGKRWLILGRSDAETPWKATDYDAMLEYYRQTESALPDLSAAAIIMETGVQTLGKFEGTAFNVNHPTEEDLALVLSDDPDVVKISGRLLDLLQDNASPADVLTAYVTKRLGREYETNFGLLRSNGPEQVQRYYELQSLERRDFPASYFALPENVKIMTIEEMFN